MSIKESSSSACSHCAPSKNAFIPWLVCLSAGLFFFYVFFQLNAFDVINQSLRDEFQINAGQLSLMSSSFVWANVLFLLPAGIILDRYPVKLVILSSMMVCILGTIGFAVTDSFLWGCFFHSLTGAANAFCFISCVILVSRWFQPQRQAFVIGCIVTMAFVGGMAAHTPLAYLNSHYGWRNSLMIDGIVGIIIWLWMFFVVRDVNHNQSQAQLQSKSYWFLMKNALLNKNNFLCGFYTSCLNLPIMVLCALWGSSYLSIVHHSSKIDASNMISLIYIGSILGCPLLGWISDRQKNRKPLMIICAIFALLIFLILLSIVSFSSLQLNILFFMIGFLTSAQVISYPFIAESNPSNQTGLATSLASIIIMGGGGLGQVVFGWLMQQHAGVDVQKYVAGDFNFAMWIFPVAILASVLAISFAKERQKK